MTDRKLMQQALEALEWWEAEFGGNEAPEPAITALRERLAQPEQSNGWVLREVLFDDGEPLGHREPTPLTDERIEQCMKQAYATVQGRNLEHAFARAIEAAHGIKE